MRKKNTFKRHLALFLSLILIFTMLPVQAFAEEVDEPDNELVADEYDDEADEQPFADAADDDGLDDDGLDDPAPALNDEADEDMEEDADALPAAAAFMLPEVFAGGEQFQFEVTVSGSGTNLQFYIPLSGVSGSSTTIADNMNKAYDWNITWGDGNAEIKKSTDSGAPQNATNSAGISHTYGSAGTYKITITGTSFTMNSVFNMPQGITAAGSSFAAGMFQNCSGGAFTMNSVFNMSQGIVTVGSDFAASMFNGCTGNGFTMNAVFNLPQGIITTASTQRFAQQMFSGCSGSAFTMNSVFNLPQGITAVNSDFARQMFSGCNGNAFTMNNVFNLPQGITTVNYSFAQQMFYNCTGTGFWVNGVFVFPALSDTELAKSSVFYQTFYGVTKTQNRLASGIMGTNVNYTPSSDRQIFTGATGFSDRRYIPANWGGGGQPLTDATKAAFDRDALTFAVIKNSNIAENNITGSLTLPTTGSIYNSGITWSASPTGYINTANGAVTRPSAGENDVTVTLTATVTSVGAVVTKDFTLTVMAHPLVTYTVTFDADGGLVSPLTMQTDANGRLSNLPVPTRNDHSFDGWFTTPSGGTQITTNTVFAANTTVYAHWTFTDSGNNNGGGNAGNNAGNNNNNDSGNSGGGTPPSPEPGPTPAPTPTPTPAPAQNQLVVQDITKMVEQNETLTVQNDNVSYEIPATAIDTAAILAALGTTDASGVTISVVITTNLSEATQTAVQNAVQSSGGTLVIPAMEFMLTATYGGKTVEINTFSEFVSRTVEVTAEQSKKISTAVIVEPNGTTRHVPTYVYQKNGKWYANINSLTNSVYALVYNERTFPDTAGKWYENTVNEMGSRNIITGIGGNQFAGEREITRAEFAAIVIRALGLPTDGNTTVFSDVSASAWYAGAVGKAYEYGIVSGDGNGSFAPDQKITRQEAMLMIQKTAKITGFKGSMGNLDAFSDAESVSDWVHEAALWNVGSGLVTGYDCQLRPQANITRAETAKLVLKLLQKAGFF